MSKEIEKYIKKVRDDANKDMKHHIDTLWEEFNHRMIGVGEWHQALDKNIKDIKRTQGSHTEQIAAILMDTYELKSDMKEVKLVIKNLLDRKVDKKYFVDLEHRVRVLERE